MIKPRVFGDDLGFFSEIYKKSLFDVAVDIRKNLPIFGQWGGYELSSANKQMFWIPEGFALGFVTL